MFASSENLFFFGVKLAKKAQSDEKTHGLGTQKNPHEKLHNKSDVSTIPFRLLRVLT